MKKLLFTFVFPLSFLCLDAQDSLKVAGTGHYIGASLHPQLGGLGSGINRGGTCRGGGAELNLGRRLKSGHIFETGLGVRRYAFRVSVPNDYGIAGWKRSYRQEETMLVVPARLRVHLNRRSEGKHQWWLNLGYIYGRRFLADAWLIDEDNPAAKEETNLQAGGNNYHFIEFGFELDAPVGTKHRVGLGVNYTQAVTTLQSGSYLNTFLQLPGIRIRFARRTW